MKAVILAGGKGTRGRPYTEYFPKAMTPINHKPLIDYIVRHLLASESIDEIMIIADLEGLGGQIRNYYQDHQYKKKITLIQDSQSGTGGDLLHVAKKLRGAKEFILWFVDNLCALDIDSMLRQFREKGCMACIATRSKRKEETGFAIVENGIIQEFKEKPLLKLPMSECLGIYILSTSILKRIEAKKKTEINLSYDILQELSREKNVSAYDIGDLEWIDVESPTVLERNKRLVSKIIKQMEC